MAVKKYIIEEVKDEKGVVSLRRSNDGFNAFELLGILEYTAREIVQQIKGEYKPDIVKRTVIEQDNEAI